MRIAFERDWAPWTDSSYLTESDLSDPGIRANIKAHQMVFPYVAFFAAHKDGEYLGYWRGPSMRPVAKSPLVWLNNEGQYSLYPPNVTVAYIIAGHSSASATSWLESLNVGVHEERVIDGPDDQPDPDELHGEFYTKLVSSST